MFRKFLVLLLSFCLITSTPFVAGVASADKSIQLLLNNVKISGVRPIMKSGVMYVPFRQFFAAMGYKVSFDPDTREISWVIRDVDILFWAGEDVIEYDGVSYEEAVVQGKLNWSDATYNGVGESDVCEALIYLKYANGHWTYCDDISLDQDFDERR